MDEEAQARARRFVDGSDARANRRAPGDPTTDGVDGPREATMRFRTERYRRMPNESRT